MPDNIYIGNFAKGLKNDRLPFNIDNDAFPTMFNFYSWRGRAKRKRGTAFLGRLQRQLDSVSSPNNWQVKRIGVTNGSGNLSANLISRFSLETTSTFVSGSFTLTDGTNTYTEPLVPNGTLIGVPGGTGTINYAIGAITITGGAAAQDLIGTFSYYPELPVLGLEDLDLPDGTQFPVNLSFDQTYAYELNQNVTPPQFFSVSYYKSTNNPVVWSGFDYQQFWSANYSKAFWATNNKPGFHFVNGTYISGSGTANITFNFKSVGVNYTNLVDGDVLWFNEWFTGGSTINFITGVVSNDTDAANGNYVVTFSSSQTVAGVGIAELLTNSLPNKDGIKWYDGDPTNNTGLPTGTGKGWVNFAPPLTGAASVLINNLKPDLYYLVGALMIVPYKDRLLFISPFIQSSQSAVILLDDTVIWSWNGTPYYTVSALGGTGAPDTASLVPTNETADHRAYFVDQTGLGGYKSAGIAQPILNAGYNQDAIIMGFGGDGRKVRFVYTGNDLDPFLFFNVNVELPSYSTFATITMDRGIIDVGTYGVALTDQQNAARIDLDIPNNVFQIQALNNGNQRVNGIRDFTNEWIYISYPLLTSKWKFPTNSFFFNYRDNTWAVFYENFTAHGYYRAQSLYTWATVPFKKWRVWNEPWNSGSQAGQVPQVIAGNPQGFVMIKNVGTDEGQSGAVNAILNATGMTQIKSYNHCVASANPQTATGDYLYFLNAIGSTYLNGQIARVLYIVDKDNFVIDIPFQAGTYLGLGTFARLSVPILQTKQFPIYWEQGRQVRLGVQKYLMDFTNDAQATVNIFLSMDPDNAWNGTQSNPPPNSLIYSQLLFTCPEGRNVTPANTNLQMPTAESQYQIWHRINQSMIGDTFQIGLTLSDMQMKNLDYATAELTCHGMHFVCYPGPMLA